MKVLHIYGPDDYAVSAFEGMSCSREDFVKYVEAGQTTFKIDNTMIYAEVLTFGPVDKAFVEFVKNKIHDYDKAKHTNFYVIEE